MTRLEVERLLSAIYPTRRERVASWVCGWAWRINDTTGPINWLGDRADDYRTHSWKRRAQQRLGSRAI